MPAGDDGIRKKRNTNPRVYTYASCACNKNLIDIGGGSIGALNNNKSKSECNGIP